MLRFGKVHHEHYTAGGSPKSPVTTTETSTNLSGKYTQGDFIPTLRGRDGRAALARDPRVTRGDLPAVQARSYSVRTYIPSATAVRSS